MTFPFYIYWGMGSGKTIAGCVCMQSLNDGDAVLVLSDKTTVEQWKLEIERMLSCNHADYSQITVDVFHYETLDHPTGPIPRRYAMIIVDEAHRFRNAWDKESKRMLSWMARILQSPRVVYLSGTPVVHDAKVEMEAFKMMMMKNADVRGQISYYDPRTDEKKAHFYADIDDRIVGCPMSWAQCFLYMQSRKQSFTLHLDGEETPRTRITSQRNTYNTLLRSICNCPFPKEPNMSPKFRAMLHWMRHEEEEGNKQVIYSSRKDTGVIALMNLWKSTTNEPKHIFHIDGSMSKEERSEQILRFNRTPKAATLFITDAAAQGVDLKRVYVVHVMEPADNVQEERQIINRAVRYKAHRERSAVVKVYRYVMSFPTSGSVEPPWKTVIAQSGMFDTNELRGISRRVQCALLHLIRDEEQGMTIDQRTISRRDVRQKEVDSVLQDMRAMSIESIAVNSELADKRRDIVKHRKSEKQTEKADCPTK